MRSHNEIRMRLLLAVCAAALMSMPMGSVPAEAADGNSGQLEQSAAAPDSQIVVYYFHGERRCKTCRTIEAYSEEVVKSRFAKELDSGAMVWQVVDYDEPENEHFIEDFGLVSASLVVVEMRNGKRVRFEVLQKAWSLASDKSGFDQYVRASLLDYMG